MLDQVILLETDQEWVERFIRALKTRGWICHVLTHADQLLNQTQASKMYLINLMYPHIDAEKICTQIRALPSGERCSIFLLNDGTHPIRSFEEALQVGADFLFFHQTQFTLLLENFPPRDSQNRSRGPRQHRSTAPRTLHNQDRVTSISLMHLHRNNSQKSQVLRREERQTWAGQGSLVEQLTSAQLQQLQNQHIPPVQSEDDFLLTPSPLPAKPVPKISGRATLGFSNQHLPQQDVEPAIARDQVRLPWGDQVSISDVEVAKALCYIFSHQLTLTIRVWTYHEWWTFTIKQGEINSLQSFNQVEHLLTQLFNQGSISAQQADKAQRTEIQGYDDLMEWLIEEENIPISDLRQANYLAFEQQLTRLFALTEGQLAITPYAPPLDPILYRGGMLRLIVDSTKATYGKLRLYERIGTTKIKPTMVGSGLYRTGLNQIERALLNHADGHRTVTELATDIGIEPLIAHSLFFVFSLLGEVQFSTVQSVSPQKSIQPSQNNVSSTALTPQSHFSQNAKLNEHPFLLRAKSQDYFQLLSLSYEASLTEIETAWRQHRSWLKAQTDFTHNEQRLMTEVLNDAYRVLAQDPCRQRYLKSLKRPLFPSGESTIQPKPSIT